MNLPFYSCLLAWWGYTLFHDENDKGFSIGIWRLSLIHNLISWKPWWKKATAVVWLSLMNDYSWGQLWAMIYWLIYDHLRDIILLLSAWDFWELCHPFFTDVPMCVSLSIVFDIWLHSMLSVLRQMLQLLVRWLYLCLSSLIFDCILCHPFLDRCRGCCLHSFLFIHPKTDVAVVYILSSSSIRRHRCNPTEFRKKHGANDLPLSWHGFEVMPGWTILCITRLLIQLNDVSA